MNSPSWTSRSSASTAGASVPGYSLRCLDVANLSQRSPLLPAARTPHRAPAEAALAHRRRPRARRARAAPRPRLRRKRSAGRSTFGAASRKPESIMASRSPSTSCNTPPPSSTSTGSCGELEPRECHTRKCDDFGREVLNDLRGDSVVHGFRQHERRELDHTALLDLPGVDSFRELARRGQAEVRRNGPLEARPRPTSVFASRGGRNGRQAEVVAPAPVSGDRAECGEPCMPAVRARRRRS